MSQSSYAKPRVRDDLDRPLNVRPLGYLALGCGVLSILLAPTLFLSLFAIPLGLLALGLGWAARTEDSTRRMGTVAGVLGLLAFLCATTLLTLGFMTG